MQSNFWRMPLGYHGRASSIVVSGTSIRRPRGQFLLNDSPTFGPCQKLDFEVEFAAFVGVGNDMGESIHVDDAQNHIFGFVLLNDWSARDVQRAETGLMGPLNGKNFATSISPWIVPLDALEPFRTKPLLKVGCSALWRSRECDYSIVYIRTLPFPTLTRNRKSQFMTSPSMLLSRVTSAEPSPLGSMMY